MVADIVLAPGAPETLTRDVLAYLREHLDRYMIPALVRLTDPFGVTPSGKIKRGEG